MVLKSLKKCSLFSEMNNSDLEMFAKKMVLKSYTKDQHIYQAGEAAQFLFVISSGKIRFDMGVNQKSDSSKQAMIYFAKENQFFGEIELLSDEKYYSRASAVIDSEIVLIPKAVFLQLVLGNQSLNQKLLKILARNLRYSNIDMANSVLKDLEFRLAHLLLHLKEVYQSDNDKESFNLDISQEEISQMLGVSRQSINKKLQLFKEQGWLRFEYGKIIFCDVKALKKYYKSL